jgi:hypothetical protein
VLVVGAPLWFSITFSSFFCVFLSLVLVESTSSVTWRPPHAVRQRTVSALIASHIAANLVDEAGMLLNLDAELLAHPPEPLRRRHYIVQRLVLLSHQHLLPPIPGVHFHPAATATTTTIVGCCPARGRPPQ